MKTYETLVKEEKTEIKKTKVKYAKKKQIARERENLAYINLGKKVADKFNVKIEDLNDEAIESILNHIDSY